MWIENLSYFITFIVTAGFSVIGILISYQIYNINKKPVLALLLYQQIFLYSFYFYGIWGNIALQLIIGDLNLSNELSAKLAFFIPVIGVPFMLISWFMLLRFSFLLNGFKSSKKLAFSYFPTLVVIVFLLAIFIQREVLLIPENADLFVVRILTIINLTIHLIFIIPFLQTKKGVRDLMDTGFNKKWAILFLLTAVVYSFALFFLDILDFISICISIILLFGAGVFIPVVIRFNMISSVPEKNMDFETFCKFYEISKREAEIVLEICSGKSNKAISEKLFITLQTVKDHNHRIYTKTGVKSRVQLANLVRERTEG